MPLNIYTEKKKRTKKSYSSIWWWWFIYLPARHFFSFFVHTLQRNWYLSRSIIKYLF